MTITNIQTKMYSQKKLSRENLLIFNGPKIPEIGEAASLALEEDMLGQRTEEVTSDDPAVLEILAHQKDCVRDLEI